MATSVMQVRVDDDLRAKAAAVYEELGIDLPTAKVIAIHGVTPQQIRFETMHSHYCLLAPSSPVAADVPVTVVEQAA